MTILTKHFFFFLVAVDLCCKLSLAAESGGLLFVAVRGILVVVATLIAEHRL